MSDPSQDQPHESNTPQSSLRRIQRVRPNEPNPSRWQPRPMALSNPRGRRAASQKKGRGMNKGDMQKKNLADRPRIWLNMSTGRFMPFQARISCILKRNLMGAWANWSMVPPDDRETYWNVFKNMYQWDSEHEVSIKKIFAKESLRLMNRIFSAVGKIWREKKETPDWLPEAHLEGLIAYWNTDEFKRRSVASTQNRAKAPKKSHTGGSIDIEDHKELIAKSIGREIADVSHAEAYLKTHTENSKESDPPLETNAPRWINDKANEPYDGWCQICTEKYGDDRSKWPKWDPKIWTEAAGRPNKGKYRGIASQADPETLGILYQKRTPYYIWVRALRFRCSYTLKWVSIKPSYERRINKMKILFESSMSDLTNRMQRQKGLFKML